MQRAQAGQRRPAQPRHCPELRPAMQAGPGCGVPPLRAALHARLSRCALAAAVTEKTVIFHSHWCIGSYTPFLPPSLPCIFTPTHLPKFLSRRSLQRRTEPFASGVSALFVTHWRQFCCCPAWLCRGPWCGSCVLCGRGLPWGSPVAFVLQSVAAVGTRARLVPDSAFVRNVSRGPWAPCSSGSLPTSCVPSPDAAVFPGQETVTGGEGAGGWTGGLCPPAV